MGDCIFCKIISGHLPAHKVYEDEKILAFLDINPVNPGHTLVVPKRHFESMIDADDGTLSELTRIAKRLGGAMMKGLDAQGFNLGVNNGAAAGQVVFHVHYHLIPRMHSDNLQPWGKRTYGAGEAERVAAVIREKLALL
ncbi:MAG: hypothetical protein A2722_03030 [Candidatus Doudnabacteria bacterium RIFCSPHIGHO2_01_FULL_50_11]|uniref:HIT domain-containing protein n=1 Tax=Candidatus Doudnabacteria bacterium RIFCSPHIGHO2_01_FULL_50_11 TaxID=1817828 RepID=A0A1F5PKI7_9BACT|nr:MAG: hypothetical protein A2722_03030 [Candidatus Doudnabacteria bacterium RIFCSPHIGHO2_01_FULL_50_11]